MKDLENIFSEPQILLGLPDDINHVFLPNSHVKQLEFTFTFCNIFILRISLFFSLSLPERSVC